MRYREIWFRNKNLHTDRLEALNGEVIRMSKVAEYYSDRCATMTPEGERLLDEMREEYQNMTEKEKCLYYGIACSYGICDECDIAERS